MMLSQMSTILFQRAISQSGTALVPWGFQPNPLDAAIQLARSLQISFTSNQNLGKIPKSPLKMKLFNYISHNSRSIA